MDIKKLIKHFFCFASVAYTIMSMLIVIAGLSLPESSYASIGEPVRFLHLFAFSLILALGSTLKRISSIPAVVARLLHAICFIGGFFVFLIVGSMEFTAAIVSSAAFALIYIAALLLASLISKRKVKSNGAPSISRRPRKKAPEKQEYTKQF